MGSAPRFPLVFLLVVLGACAGRGPEPGWGARWPAAAELGHAAADSVRSPGTWGPLAVAALLSAAGRDERLSDWAARETPVFGDSGDSASDHLRTASQLAYVVSALAVPSPSLADRMRGLATGAAAMVAERTLTDALKDATDRRRPDGSDNRSFPSGHAASASTAATLARRNLDYLDLPAGMDLGLRVTLHGLAAGTAWARVEADKHHVSDVLVGNALGHALGAFFHQAFMRPVLPRAELGFRPLPGGGALTLSVALR